jgi:hypothetical protein
MADAKPTKTDAFARIQAHAEVAHQRLIQKTAETPVQMFLPGMDEFMRAMPNHFARSSLFAPVARGRRKTHDGTELVSRSDVRLRFWGKQLDEADCDVWMQALHEVRKVPLGQSVTINRAEFLKAIGRNDSGVNYQWLHEAFERLWQGGLAIETKQYAIGTTPRSRYLRLVNGFDHNPETNSYDLHIDTRMLALFSNKEFALIDWQKRLQIEHQTDMAKSLQRLVVASSDTVQRYALDNLKERMQYSSPKRKFREALTAAMRELARLEIISRPHIEESTRGKEQAVWTRL